MKRHILFLAGIFSIFTLIACKNSDLNEDGGTDEAYICIETESARTIRPTFTLEDLRYFCLYGKKNESDEEMLLGNGCETYEELIESTFAISTGIWYEFKLTAQKNGNQFVGTISNKEIVQGKNTLHFTLSLETESTGSGEIGRAHV